MSGTFQDINVPPMLMAFGITTVDASKVISTDLKGAGHRIYLVRHTPLENRMPDTAQLKENFAFVSGRIESGKILSAWSVGFGGVGEGLAKMAFGNGVGAEITLDEPKLYEYAYGSILVECEGTLEYPHAELLGFTVAEEALTVNATAVVLAHNHPSGSAIPSREDIDLTLRLRDALDVMDILLLDHLVIADDDFVSMSDSGYLRRAY